MNVLHHAFLWLIFRRGKSTSPVSWSEARYVLAPCHLMDLSDQVNSIGKDCVLISAFSYPEKNESVTRILLLISRKYSFGEDKLVSVAKNIQNYKHPVHCEINNEIIAAYSVEFPSHSLGHSEARGVLIECRCSSRRVESLKLSGSIKTFDYIRFQERVHYMKARPIVFLIGQIHGDPANLNARLAYEYIKHHTTLGADLFIGTLCMCRHARNECSSSPGSRLEDTPWLMRWAFNQTNMHFIDIQRRIEKAASYLASDGVHHSIHNRGAGLYITLYEGIQLCKAIKAEWVVRIDIDEWLVSQAFPGVQKFLPTFLDQIKKTFPSIDWLATFSRLVAAIPTHPERPRLATQFTHCFQGPNSPEFPTNQCSSSAHLFSPEVYESPLTKLFASSQENIQFSTTKALGKYETVSSNHHSSRGKWIARVDRITYGNIHHAGPTNGFAIPSHFLVLMHLRSIAVGNIAILRNSSDDIERICREYQRKPHCRTKFPKYCGIGFCCLRHCDWLEPYAWDVSVT